MARSWEYSPRRRIAMQIVMWIIFGLTLVLAGFISHSKQTGPLLLAPPTKIGNLMVQIPWNWHEKVAQIDSSWILRASPMRNVPTPFTGELRITQQALPSTSADAPTYLANGVLGAVVPTTPISFSGLGRPGVMAEFENSDDTDDASSETVPTGIYAVAIVPIGLGKSLAVMVVVEDLAPFTHDDYELLRQIVQTIKLAPT